MTTNPNKMTKNPIQKNKKTKKKLKVRWKLIVQWRIKKKTRKNNQFKKIEVKKFMIKIKVSMMRVTKVNLIHNRMIPMKFGSLK